MEAPLAAALPAGTNAAPLSGRCLNCSERLKPTNACVGKLAHTVFYMSVRLPAYKLCQSRKSRTKNLMESFQLKLKVFYCHDIQLFLSQLATD